MHIHATSHVKRGVGVIPKSKSGLKTTATVLLKAIKLTGYGFILFFTAFKAPATHKVWSDFRQATEKEPKPVYTTLIRSERSLPTIDNFVANHKGFDRIRANFDIKSETLDFNRNKTSLDNISELQNLREEIEKQKNKSNEKKVEEALKILDEIIIASKLIWGSVGPKPENLVQGLQDNCKVMAAVQSNLFSDENIQKIKEKIRVVNFISDKKSFKFDLEVDLNGQRIHIPYEELVKLKNDVFQSYSKDRSLAVTVLTHTIQEELNKYKGGSYKLSDAAGLITLTGEDFCSVPVMSLSDNQLKEILSKAPEVQIILNTSPVPTLDSSIIWKIGKEEDNLKELMEEHAYAVKEAKEINGKFIVTIMDSNDSTFNLNINNIREEVSYITTKKENIPNIDFISLFLSLTLLFGLGISCETAIKKINNHSKKG